MNIWTKPRVESTLKAYLEQCAGRKIRNARQFGLTMANYGIPQKSAEGFFALTANAEGIVADAEVTNFLNSLVGVNLASITDLDRVLFKLVDRDNSGAIDPDEFLKFCKAMDYPATPESIAAFLSKERVPAADFELFNKFRRIATGAAAAGQAGTAVPAATPPSLASARTGIAAAPSGSIAGPQPARAPRTWVWTRDLAEKSIREFTTQCRGRTYRTPRQLDAALEGFGIPSGIGESLFALMDEDRSGRIEPTEVCSFLERLVGVDLLDERAADRALFSVVDRDGNGTIDPDEMLRFCLAMQLPVDMGLISSFLKKKGLVACNFDQFMTFKKLAQEIQQTKGSVFTRPRIVQVTDFLDRRFAQATRFETPALVEALEACKIPEQLQGEFFRIADEQNTGTIERDDVIQFLEALVGIDLEDSRSTRRVLFRLIDRDKSGFLDAAECARFCHALGWPQSPESFQAYFDSCGIAGFNYGQFVSWYTQGKETD